MGSPRFTPGLDVAMKIPRQHHDATVAFYRDVLGLEVEEVESTGATTVTRSFKVAFGPVTLWLDRVDNYAHPDVWLELHTDDLDAAVAKMAEAGIHPCDEVEPLTDADHRSHWIKNPAGVVHLLAEAPDPA